MTACLIIFRDLLEGIDADAGECARVNMWWDGGSGQLAGWRSVGRVEDGDGVFVAGEGDGAVADCGCLAGVEIGDKGGVGEEGADADGLARDRAHTDDEAVIVVAAVAGVGVNGGLYAFPDRGVLLSDFAETAEMVELQGVDFPPVHI